MALTTVTPPTAAPARRCVALVIVGFILTLSSGRAPSAAERAEVDEGKYRPQLAVPEFMEPFLKHVEPGSDAFPEERDAMALEARLASLGEALRSDPAKVSRIAESLLAPEFRGGRLLSGGSETTVEGTLEVTRATGLPQEPSLDARAFGAELRQFVEEMREVTVTEFLVTSIEGSPEHKAPAPQGKGLQQATQDDRILRTIARYDIVGAGKTAWRIQHVGVWRMTWRQIGSQWRVLEWVADAHVTSRAKSPVFTEVTEAALGANDSFARQLNTGLDAWTATLDSVLTRDSNGHHGVSVGDADGDGLEDLYVAQPAGLPNRLFRARADSTFEDITDRAGLAVLDDTAHSLFADVDNDGDQDLVLSTAMKPLLFINDGSGRFSELPDAFQFQRPLQGVLTSIAMADYDRDGFLDLYLCVYSYFFGAGEDKAGTPAPYYDARNGPPGVLFRNDGRGRFIDVTQESGLDEGNDRYHFAAAWADYDGDGWLDLLVANDFGTKNLYRNRGRQNGKVTFEDVAAAAGVLDHGAGMSATFVDYDNDGLLDIYTGNMWSASGLRVTAAPAFMPEAPSDVRALYHRHARGNSLFRNLGNGRFDDKTLAARAEMGRWAWSSDALDFDSDGWEDLYVVNGMLTREDPDLDSFFWRQVVARSPQTRARGTPYDDAWRSINQLLIRRSIASRQRNVFLRNNGHGQFDDISGTVGLDLDQDGRSFAVLDLDRDGDPDLAVMAARHAPQLRVFRNDFPRTSRSLAIRLKGTTSNRDAIGARVTIETERVRRTKTVLAGSGFLSQHSRELLFGLGPSERIVKLTVDWPSGHKQEFSDVIPNTRLTLVEGGALEPESLGSRERDGIRDPGSGVRKPARAAGSRTSPASMPSRDTWLYEPVPAPEFSLQDTGGETRSTAALEGRPALLLFWSTKVKESVAALEALGAASSTLTPAGISAVAIALDSEAESPKIPASTSALPVVVATREVGLSYAILHRHLFMNRQDLLLPTMLLLDPAGRVVKAYRSPPDAARILQDVTTIEVSAAERVARAVPFRGTFHSALPRRNYLPYGRELLDQGLEAAAITAFDRAAEANPSPSTLYRLGTLLLKSGETARARAAFERALSLQPDLAEASNDLGTLLAQEGELDAAIERFRSALTATPEYPDALNNLGYAMLLTGRDEEARALYEKALALQPDFPEALNNLGLLYGRAGTLDRAEHYFEEALTRRENYGEAANNLALVLVARGQSDQAVRLLEDFIAKSPQFEAAYVTLAKIHLNADRSREGIQVLERLLQRNPTHPVALELLREWKAR